MSFLILALVGLLAQLIDGSLGMAYGVTSSSLLLTYGLTPAMTSASVHLAEVGTSLMSGLSHWRFDNVDWRTVRRLAIPGAVGAFLGAVFLSSIASESATPWMAGLLLALGVYVIVRFLRQPRAPRGRSYVRHRYLAALGLFAGFLDATGGGGWGPVATPTLLVTGKLEPRKVIGSVDTTEFVVAVAASGGFLWALGSAGVDRIVVVALLVGGVVAAPIAAWLVRRMAARVLGTLAGGLIVLTNARSLAIYFRVEVPPMVALVALVVWGSLVVFSYRRNRVESAVTTELVPVPAPGGQPEG